MIIICRLPALCRRLLALVLFSTIANCSGLSAFAAPRIPTFPVTLAFVQGIAVAESKLVDAFEEVAIEFKEEAGFIIRATRIKHVSDVYPQRTFDNWSQELWQWERRFRGVRQIHLVFAPALEGEYMAGRASICFPDTENVAETHVKDAMFSGLDSFWALVTLVKHELGHLFGAYHDDGTHNTMNSTALIQGELGRMNFSVKSITEMRKCLRSVRRQRGGMQ